MRCCTYDLVSSNTTCRDDTSVACIVSAAAVGATRLKHTTRGFRWALTGRVPCGRQAAKAKEERLKLVALAEKAEQARVDAEVKALTEKAAALPDDADDLMVHQAASMVLALAFLTPDQEAQWFGQLTLKEDGEPVLSVSRGERGFGAMEVKVDGKIVKEGEGQITSKRSGLRARLVRTTKFDWHASNVHSQAVAVVAPGFKFSIESAPAKHKYSEVADQIKFGHLNLKFDQDAFPKFSNGFLAQLAGARSLTDRSESRFNVGHTRIARGSGSGLLPDPNGLRLGEDGHTPIFVPLVA